MGCIRRFGAFALAAALGSCASFSQWLDKLEGKEARPSESVSAAAAPRKAMPTRPASPPPKPVPPPSTWSAELPNGARIRFGSGESIALVNPDAATRIACSLGADGWARQFGALPSIYFVEIDNREGRTDVNWGIRDRIVLAADGRTFEQDSSLGFRSALKQFGGYEQTVLPGTTGVVPVAFVDPVPLRSISVLRIQSGSVSIPLACDTKAPNSGDANAATPAR